jgi:hypothetical protein
MSRDEDADFEDDDEEDEDEDKDEETQEGSIYEETEDDSDWEDESNDDDLDSPPLIPFQVLVSHVCHYWRRVAIETPCLWNQVDFAEGKPYEKSQAYLERSKGYPLCVTIDCTEDDPDSSMSSVSGDFACGCSDLPAMLALAMPHIGRWAEFVLRAMDYTDIHTTLTALTMAPSAPLLESLELYHHEDEGEQGIEKFTPADLKTPFVLFNNNLPKLKHVVLWGVHIDWNNTRFLKNLTHLELAYHSQDVRPTFEDFFNILGASPSLEVLELCSTGPAGNPSGWSTILPPPLQDHHNSLICPSRTTNVEEFLTLQRLQRLTLGFQPPDYVMAILDRLSLPSLQELSFDFEDYDYSTFVEYITSPAKNGANPHSIIGNLKTFKLVQLPCSRYAARKLYESLKKLESLRLNFHYLDYYFLELLCEREYIPTDSSADSSTTYPLLPSLTCLMVNGVETSQIRDFVQARIDAGVPLKKLYVDGDLDDDSWLKEHVEEFRYFEDSDDEFSEFDEDDVESWLDEHPVLYL